MRTDRLRVDVTGRTFLKAVITAALVWAWLYLWKWVLLFVVAVFIAVGLDPIVGWLEARRVKRAYGSVLVVGAIAALLLAFAWRAGAQLLEQGRMLGERIDEIQAEVSRRAPEGLLQMLPQPGSEPSEQTRSSDAPQPAGSGGQFASYASRLGRAIVNGVLAVGVALVLTVYLLIDGRRTYEWLVAFAPGPQRPRVRRTARAARDAVVGYVRGNVATSVLAGICAYVFLRIVGVPAALLLALLTGIFDFIPVLGIFLTAIPMVLLALTVSAGAAIATLVFNVIYNVVENYYVAPKVYGNQMRLSSLAVVLAFAVGAELGGVVGALVALPFAAMYPAVESLWLARRLGPEVARDHRRIEQSDEH
ncbi:MAG TPA: AI-2E family transporter [Vicinamibacterales bacterium]|nr:AI-2E family transporter [Vicinamibacterales bacterium]